MALSGFVLRVPIELINIQTGELLRFLIMAIGISIPKLSVLSKRLQAYPYVDKPVFIIYPRIQRTFSSFYIVICSILIC